MAAARNPVQRMNDTLKTIVGILEGGKPELQVAAAQILGELRAKDPTAVRALADGIVRSPVLGRFCLDALAKIATQPALASLAQAVVANEILADHAAHLLGEIGAPSHGVLAKIYPQAIGDQRARILAVLARQLGPEALQVFVHALLTPDTTELAASLLQAQAAQFDAATIKQLRQGLAPHIDQPLPDVCLAQVLAVLARVDAAGSKAVFVKHIDATAAPLVRSAAFRALRGSKLTANQVAGMMALLEDPSQKDVHEAVRDVLVELPELPAGTAPGLKRLLASRHPEQRLFAARMLRTAGGIEMARAFLKLLDHDDPRFRAAARAGLANNKQAIEPVLKLMLATRNPELAQDCGTVLASLAPQMAPKLQKSMAERAVKLLPGNTRLGDLLLDLVLHAGGAKIVPFLIEKAVRLRRAHRRPEALHLLAKVAASGHGGDEAHYQIALTKLLGADDAAEADGGAPGNSTMGFFASLVRAGFPLFDRLRRESAVTPDMLLRIATHFAAAVGPERRFGTEVLQHLAVRTKGRAGDEARLALRAVGS